MLYMLYCILHACETKDAEKLLRVKGAAFIEKAYNFNGLVLDQPLYSLYRHNFASCF